MKSLDITNLALTVTIHLFILSLISERIADFIKLNFQRLYEKPDNNSIESMIFPVIENRTTSKNNKQKIQNFFENTFGNFRDTENSSIDEKLREGGITTITIICGIFIAFVCKADLFFLLKNGALRPDFGFVVEFKKINGVCTFVGFVCKALSSKALWGCLFSGFFLSLGSKFWHDLLDLLFYTANLKKKLSDKNTFNLDNTADFDSFISQPQSKIIQSTIENNQTILKSIKGVLYIIAGKKWENGSIIDCIIVHVENNSVEIPTFLTMSMPNGSSVSYPTLKVVDTLPKICAVNDLPDEQDGVANENSPTFFGTCTGIITKNNDEKTFLVTCNHVMSGGTTKNSNGWIPIAQQTQVLWREARQINQDKIVGNWSFSMQNENIDLAFIELNDEMLERVKENLTPFVGGIYRISDKDVLKTKVQMLGFISDTQEGFIMNYNKPVDIAYNDKTIRLNSLILVADTPFDNTFCRRISNEGDSGSILTTLDGKPIGMVVAQTQRYTFAIPIEKIYGEILRNNLKIMDITKF